MKFIKDNNQLEVLKECIIQSMQDKKAYDIISIDLRQLNNAITDIFILCHGTSDKQVEAIADNIIENVNSMLKEKPWQKEGFENKEWILLDYVNIVTHIFTKEKREFYSIEELWGDGEIKTHEYDEVNVEK